MVPEYEDKTDRSRYCHCFDSHHYFVGLSWLSLLSSISISLDIVHWLSTLVDDRSR